MITKNQLARITISPSQSLFNGKKAGFRALYSHNKYLLKTYHVICVLEIK